MEATVEETRAAAEEGEAGEMSNKCTRCGKERVVTKTYKQKVGTSYVCWREMACSDPECQKKVNKGLSNEKKKRTEIKNEQNKREEERKQRLADNGKSSTR